MAKLTFLRMIRFFRTHGARHDPPLPRPRLPRPHRRAGAALRSARTRAAAPTQQAPALVRRQLARSSSSPGRVSAVLPVPRLRRPWRRPLWQPRPPGCRPRPPACPWKPATDALCSVQRQQGRPATMTRCQSRIRCSTRTASTIVTLMATAAQIKMVCPPEPMAEVVPDSTQTNPGVWSRSAC